MKHSHLSQIIVFMQHFQQIERVYRVSDTQIVIEFDKNTSWTFDMRRDNPMIFSAPDTKRTKIYQAPFDVLLAKRLNRSSIQSVTMHNNDKILRIVATTSGSYKSETTILQFEFTGKYTNVILLDKDEIVLEALRHIDEMVSVRSVRVGEALTNPPPPTFTPVLYPLDDVEAFLRHTYEEYAASGLERLKKEKLSLITKRTQQLQKHLRALSDEEALLEESSTAQHYGHLILANLHTIKGYETSLKLNDFDGTPLEIAIPPECHDGARMADTFFKRSKKGKQKALGLFQERENLTEKIHHLELFAHTIREAQTPEEITRLFPSKVAGTKTKAHTKVSDGIEEFWIEGIKVSLGKSERGNIELLQRSRARDIWLHLKDRPSAHVIITTDKQQLPQSILEAAAKLCVDFSVFEKGTYLVDYTPRREVRVQEGANVLYTNYKTVSVEKK
ncbi:MAG: NFACT family protein [Sulfurimonas sp.]|jgi:predicted ribosome quality control (RQC) complex YloA/Tae2 family protein